jgi:hypothetical protein
MRKSNTYPVSKFLESLGLSLESLTLGTRDEDTSFLKLLVTTGPAAAKANSTGEDYTGFRLRRTGCSGGRSARVVLVVDRGEGL